MVSERIETGKPVRIAAFAVENDTVLCALFTGEVTPAHQFRFREIEGPTSTKLGRSLAKSEVADFVGSFLKVVGVQVDVIGISTYGAIDRDRAVVTLSPSDRSSLPTIRNLDIRGALKRVAPDTPVILDNDASAACVGEVIWGAGRRTRLAPHSTYSFIWVSRGINAGFTRGREMLDVRFRPETGHLPAHIFDEAGVRDSFPGNCPSHRSRPCITGMAGLSAVVDRLAMPDYRDEDVLDISADYIAQLCAVVMMTMAPAQIAIGGLQMRSIWGDELFERIKVRYSRKLTGFPLRTAEAGTGEMIVKSELGSQASLWGIAEIARRHIMPQVMVCGEEDAG